MLEASRERALQGAPGFSDSTGSEGRTQESAKSDSLQARLSRARDPEFESTFASSQEPETNRVDANDTGLSPERIGEAQRFASFERTQRYQSIIDLYGEEHNVDPALIAAVIVAESGGDPNAESSAGAAGLMQLMPRTADSLEVTDRLNPEQNIEGGTKYLSMLIDRYNGDLNKVLAAYNAGPTAVTNNRLPQETQDYVPKVLALRDTLKNMNKMPLETD